MKKMRMRENKTQLPLNINIACTINENLSKDLIVMWLSEALQGLVGERKDGEGERKNGSEMG